MAVARKNGNKEEVPGRDARGIYSGGVMADMENDNLAKEFISVGKSIEDSMGRTVFVDIRQLHAAIALYRKLLKFDNTQGMIHFKMSLDGMPAVGGYNRAQAGMVAAQVVVPEAIGVKLGKDSMKFIEAQYKAKTAQQQGENENNG